MKQASIPFMHNYCNRWCERCPLGHRCAIKLPAAVFKDEFEQALNLLEEGEAEDSSGQESAELGFAEDHSSYFPAWDDEGELPDEEFERQQQELKARIAQHPLPPLAARAAQCVEMVCERLQGLLKERPQISSEGLSWRQSLEAECEGQMLDNYLDILRWYRFPLEVKTRRALSGLLDDEEDEDEVQNDWNGSAKVVKIAISHCHGAARGLLARLPELEDELLLLLGQLQDFENALDDSFPHANEFIRPGFDTLGIKEELGV